MQREIPYMLIRGGSSKGLYFKAEDLPSNENERNNVLLLAMEGTLHGDARQIDGLGGSTSLTSKVAIISKSTNPKADLDYFFVQVVVGKGKVSTVQTCGNILAGVLPFAIESGMIGAQHPTTSAKINLVNTGGICEIVLETPNNEINYIGSAKVDGVPGTGAPIICNYLDTIGSTCGALFPSGNATDIIEGISCTLIDNGMPVVILKASDFNLKGNESIEDLENNATLKKKLEIIRIQAGQRMQLGNVTNLTIPKMCLISPAFSSGTINTRMFIPHVVHEAIGVLAAISVSTACKLPGTVCESIVHNLNNDILSIEHPTGEMSVSIQIDQNENNFKSIRSGVIRTARIISKGEVYISA